MTGDDAVYWKLAMTTKGLNRETPNYLYLGRLRRRSAVWCRVVNNCMDELNAATAHQQRRRLPSVLRHAARLHTDRPFGARGNKARRRIERILLGPRYRRPKRPDWTIDR